MFHCRKQEIVMIVVMDIKYSKNKIPVKNNI